MNIVRTGNGIRNFTDTGLVARKVDFTEIPQIDFGPMASEDIADRLKVAAALKDACMNVGFFYLRNHGVPQEVIDATFDAAKRFFATPFEEKMRIHIRQSNNHRGYGPLLEENTDPTAKGDLHEAFDLSLDIPADDAEVLAGHTLHGPNVWPESVPNFREPLTHYYDEMILLGRRIFQAFALALELDEDFFAPKIKRPGSSMRVLYYPPQEGVIDEKQIGIGAHSDYECFTILAQGGDVEALQVLNASGEWISAPPIPGAFVVNIGDQMARWSNDLFKSTLHRVINRSGRERYSIPFFYGCDYATILTPLPNCVDEEHPAKYEPVTAYEYVSGRFAETYGYFKKEES